MSLFIGIVGLSIALFSCSLTKLSASLPLEAVLTIDAQGHLNYVPDEQGNILPDFSHSGYQRSEQPIPFIEAKVVIKPIQGDNTRHIQKAIDQLAQMPLQEDGFRGALVLGKGMYPVSGQLVISKNGIVLRGEGQSESDSVIFATGKDRRSLIHIKGNLHLNESEELKQKILGAYIPVGINSVSVKDTSAFSIGQEVIVFRPATAKWIEDIGMDRIPKRTDGREITQWEPKRYGLSYERKIIDIQGSELFLDIPLVQMMEEQYGGGFIYPVEATGRIENIGIENIRLVSEYEKGQETIDEEHSWIAIEISDAENTWVSDVTAKYFAHALVAVKRGSRFVTVRDSISLDPVSRIQGGRRYSFYLEGSQALFLRCYARHGRHDFITSSRVTGPSAFVYSVAEQTHSDIGPHHRWATGILYDNVKGDEINIQDRGNFGSGHGWVGAQQVLWNTQAGKRTAVQSPPTGINWSIGHIGPRWRGRFERPQGLWISEGEHVKPDSLFVQQLFERIGAEQAKKVLERGRYAE